MRRLVLGIAIATAALLPAVSIADDQQIADFVKSRLQLEQQRGNLRGFNVDMQVERGTVWFKGFVSNAAQEQLILRTAQQAGPFGVVKVVDDIDVRPSQYSVVDYRQPAGPQLNNQNAHRNAAYRSNYPRGYQEAPMQVAPTQGAPMQAAPMQPIPMESAPTQRAPMQYAPPQAVPMQEMPMQYAPQSMPVQGATMPQMMTEPMTTGPVIDGQPMPFAMASAASPTPVAMGSASMPMESPNLPGYAWPGYAAYPNYSAVTYPRMYSPSAWPYIGPFYPYPQVPLGWRKVSLEWDDGWWYLDFNDRSH